MITTRQGAYKTFTILFQECSTDDNRQYYERSILTWNVTWSQVTACLHHIDFAPLGQ